jgi:hypothetical protein
VAAGPGGRSRDGSIVIAAKRGAKTMTALTVNKLCKAFGGCASPPTSTSTSRPASGG